MVPIPVAGPIFGPAGGVAGGSVLGACRTDHELARRAARSAARQLVAEHFGCPPSRQRWQRGARGRPLLGHPAGVHVSMSHGTVAAEGGGVAAAAASVSGPVGIDVEPMRPVQDVDELAETVFAAVERHALAQLEGVERHRMFLRLWTRKEAVLKALGTGLSGGLASVVTDAGGALLQLPDGCGGPDGWSVVDLPSDGAVIGAVAIKAPGRVVVRTAARR
ncbi:4'-phosphopantetheinyl transferase family protein [Streptomyces sp. CA-111067]|uniref:4'-phosphopantetheinyl transferase family protein n=1 Tax=Streptomyces sp. CA-111067 TaxID=3240046 RepID=UPI003D965E3C